MAKRSSYMLLVGALALAMISTAPLAASDGQDEDDKFVTRVHIERQGDDGGEVGGEHHVVFIGEDGEKHEISGEGGDFAWFSGDDDSHSRMAMRHRGMGKGGFLGVSTTTMTPELRSHFGVPETAGVLVSSVVDDSAAFKAGLMVGDIITAVDGGAIGSTRDLVHAVRSNEEGASVNVELWRDGQVQDVVAVLEKTEGRQARMWTGMTGHGMRGMKGMRAMKIDCEDGGNCEIIMPHTLDACDGEGDCEVKISCDDGECSCTVDGVVTDCDQLHTGVHGMHDE